MVLVVYLRDIMLTQIKEIASLLGMGQGEVLKLARQISGDGALIAIEFLPWKQQNALLIELSWMKDLGREFDIVAAKE